jgi:ribonuclease P protein component
LRRAGARDASGSHNRSSLVRRYASLRGRREFAFVLRRGRASQTKHLAVTSVAAPASTKLVQSTARVGIVITKKVGTAVERNRLRRRCKAILDQSSIANSAMWYVVVFRPTAAQLSYQHLQEQIESTLAASVRSAGTVRPHREIRNA